MLLISSQTMDACILEPEGDRGNRKTAPSWKYPATKETGSTQGINTPAVLLKLVRVELSFHLPDSICKLSLTLESRICFS